MVGMLRSLKMQMNIVQGLNQNLLGNRMRAKAALIKKFVPPLPRALTQVSSIDVRKEVSFCKKVDIKVLGVVENMSGLCQPLADVKFLKPSETGENTDVTEWALQYIKEQAPELLNLFSYSEVFDSSGGGALKMC